MMACQEDPHDGNAPAPPSATLMRRLMQEHPAKTKFAGGAAVGALLFAALPASLGTLFGVGALGPQAGGVFAALQSAGYLVPGVQSFVMGASSAGLAVKGALLGGTAGLWRHSRFQPAAAASDSSDAPASSGPHPSNGNMALNTQGSPPGKAWLSSKL